MVNYLVIKYNNFLNFSSRLYKITTDSIYLQKRKKRIRTSIALKDIEYIIKLQKFQKALPIVILSVVALLLLGLAFGNSRPQLGLGFSILAAFIFYLYTCVAYCCSFYSHTKALSCKKLEILRTNQKLGYPIILLYKSKFLVNEFRNLTFLY